MTIKIHVAARLRVWMKSIKTAGLGFDDVIHTSSSISQKVFGAGTSTLISTVGLRLYRPSTQSGHNTEVAESPPGLTSTDGNPTKKTCQTCGQIRNGRRVRSWGEGKSGIRLLGGKEGYSWKAMAITMCEIWQVKGLPSSPIIIR